MSCLISQRNCSQPMSATRALTTSIAAADRSCLNSACATALLVTRWRVAFGWTVFIARSVKRPAAYQNVVNLCHEMSQCSISTQDILISLQEGKLARLWG